MIHQFKQHFDYVFEGLEDLVLQTLDSKHEEPSAQAIARVDKALREKQKLQSTACRLTYDEKRRLQSDIVEIRFDQRRSLA